MKTYLIVDANNLAARCHHAMNELSMSDGSKTGAILGFLKGLSWVRWKTQISLRDTVVIWDGGHCAHRKQLLPTYKAGRKLNEPKTPEQQADSAAYKAQLTWIKEILTHLEVRQIQVGGVEADDLISIFSNLATKEGNHSIIFSGDGDMHQLSSSSCRIFDPKKSLLGWGDIKSKWGVDAPDDLRLFKALCGDASDNIKGAPQIGLKRAKIVCAYLRCVRRNVGEGFAYYVEPKTGRKPEPDSKDAKLVAKAITHKKILMRNLMLMVLPKTFEDSFMSFEQYESALVQWLSPGTRNTRSFIEQLERFELHSILENLSNW